MNTISITAACVLLAISAGAANAECVGHRVQFRLTQNQTVSKHFVTDDGKCQTHFHSGSGSIFTAASIATVPQHGTLKQSGRFLFNYQANAGFKGEDHYAIKLCGTEPAGSGCATVNYVGTIE